MNIRVSKLAGSHPAAALQLDGKLDSSNYTEFIRKAQELFAEGSRNLVIDLRQLEYMSSAGLMALHTVARLFSGTRDGQEETANSYRSIDPRADKAIQQHVKLLGPQPKVLNLLEMVGLGEFFEVFSDLDSALKSFDQ